MAAHYHLAQVNIARMLYPREDARMAGFFDRLAEINAIADASPGFVWRLQDESGDATYIRPYEDDRILFNLTVWESVEALSAYVYKTAHKELIGGRRRWFEMPAQPILALWWVPAGHIPSIAEAQERLAHLRTHGPTESAFSFKSIFPHPEVQEAGSGL